eukprot:GFYU01006230.1.p1 GENE.GFYU01006230.1~~GFYU01006230.1.p1  ORF type:complete len:300 (+),score=69.67 GFYU01006230.1:23-901(+)
MKSSHIAILGGVAAAGAAVYLWLNRSTSCPQTRGRAPSEPEDKDVADLFRLVRASEKYNNALKQSGDASCAGCALAHLEVGFDYLTDVRSRNLVVTEELFNAYLTCAQLWTHALEMYRNNNNRPGEAKALIYIVLAHWGVYLGNRSGEILVEGRNLLDDAKKILDEIGDPESDGPEWAYQNALYYRMIGDMATCEKLLDEAGEMAHDLVGGPCALQARTYYSKHNLLRGKDNRKAYQNAVIAEQMWREVLGPDHPDTRRAATQVANPDYEEYRKEDAAKGLFKQASSGFLKV